MICTDFTGFAAVLKPHGALLGLDLGTKTIGMAYSDTGRTIATALGIIKRTKFTADAAHLSTVIDERAICGVVLGLPRNMDGSEGPRAQSTRAFAQNLTQTGGVGHLPLMFWDERLSTVAAEKILIAADMTRKRRAQVVDAVAASYILQGALDRLHHLQAPQ